MRDRACVSAFFMIQSKIIWLVRHGESIGNVARHEAEKCSALLIETPHREPDVQLSPLGIHHSKEVGKWFRAQSEKPTIIYTSPYTRAQETTQLLFETAGFHHNEIKVKLDERLREREFGVFDCLTKEGAMLKYPDLCELRARSGKFYFRPPGGESWADVVFRLRSFIETDLVKLNGENVLIVSDSCSNPYCNSKTSVNRNHACVKSNNYIGKEHHNKGKQKRNSFIFNIGTAQKSHSTNCSEIKRMG